MKEQIEQKAQVLRLALLEDAHKLHEFYRKLHERDNERIEALRALTGILNDLDPGRHGLLAVGSYAIPEPEGKE